jgi:acyl-CoA hydrolase
MFVDSFLELIKAGILRREVDGALLHAAFFIGPKSFYRALREMPDSLRAKIQMKAVSFVNELYGGESEKRRARVNARFINSAMMATMLGAAISDGLENGQVVSGVGGQYNFVAQAFALEGARSILTVHATRNSGGKITSNIRWFYGHETIPRHLRDIIVTEYGVANLRGKSDQDVIAAMLSVADSRFQAELLRQARDAKKIPASYQIPKQHCENTPERIERVLKPFVGRGLLSPFPLGCDFTEIEQTLIPALQLLQQASRSPAKLLPLAFRGFFGDGASKYEAAALNRMGYDYPKNLAERFYRALLRAALAETGS